MTKYERHCSTEEESAYHRRRSATSKQGAAMGQWQDPGLGDYAGMDADRVRTLLLAAARMAHTQFNAYPAWLFAGEVFRVGPKMAENLCVHAGLDPYLTVGDHRRGPATSESAQSP